jgi:hypothetical protein
MAVTLPPARLAAVAHVGRLTDPAVALRRRAGALILARHRQEDSESQPGETVNCFIGGAVGSPDRRRPGGVSAERTRRPLKAPQAC